MTDSSELLGSNEFHAHFFGTLRQMPEHPLALALLVVILALIGVFLTLAQHRINQASQLVSRRGYGLGLVHAGAHAPEAGAQSRLTTAQRASGQPQGQGRPVRTALGLAAHPPCHQ